MYEFNMEKLLKSFDNNPEALASAFADQLNTTLVKHRKEEAFFNTAEELSKSWNDFVEEYFNFYQVDKKNIENFKFQSGQEVIDFLKIFIEAFPEIEKYVSILEKLGNTTDKITASALDNIDAFQEKMKNFFKNNDI